MRIVIADTDDWQGLYLDGVLVMQNHSLDLDDVLEAIGVEFTTREVDGEFLWEAGRLPLEEADVVWRE